MSDKKKITILISIISFTIILIVFLCVIAFLSIRAENMKKSDNLTTTTRRTFSTTTKETSNPELPQTTTTKNSVTKTTMRTSNTISKTRTTTKRVTTSSNIPEKVTRPTTTSSIDYPNALDSWEWNIVDAINKERKENGLNELQVATDLREIAHEKADDWINLTDNEFKTTLKGYSFYGKKSNNLNRVTGYNSLITSTKDNTVITKTRGLSYLGVAVLYKEQGFNGIPTHYYVIIYE